MLCIPWKGHWKLSDKYQKRWIQDDYQYLSPLNTISSTVIENYSDYLSISGLQFGYWNSSEIPNKLAKFHGVLTQVWIKHRAVFRHHSKGLPVMILKHSGVIRTKNLISQQPFFDGGWRVSGVAWRRKRNWKGWRGHSQTWGPPRPGHLLQVPGVSSSGRGQQLAGGGMQPMVQ